MRLPDLKFNFISLSQQQQRTVFLEYYQKRERDLDNPIKFSSKKASPATPRKPKGQQITLTSDQLDLLRKLKLI